MEEIDVGAWGKLISLSPEHADVNLIQEEETLGRHASCSVVFNNQHLSSRHCMISRDKSGVVMVKDLSTNGTFVNGELIGKNKQTVLNPMDEISLLMPNSKNVPCVRYMYKERATHSEEENGPDKDYHIKQILGTGNFATVKLGVSKTSGEKVAIKCIDKKKMVGGSSRAEVMCCCYVLSFFVTLLV